MLELSAKVVGRYSLYTWCKAENLLLYVAASDRTVHTNSRNIHL